MTTKLKLHVENHRDAAYIVLSDSNRIRAIVPGPEPDYRLAAMMVHAPEMHALLTKLINDAASLDDCVEEAKRLLVLVDAAWEKTKP